MTKSPPDFFIVIAMYDDISMVSYLGLAVSVTSNPTSDFYFYQIPVTNDGTEGTQKLPLCPCLGDYPQLSIDKSGVYISTNQFGPFPSFQNYTGAQIYALSKSDCIQGKAAKLIEFNTQLLDDENIGNPGFTVIPAVSTGGVYDNRNGGTMYFFEFRIWLGAISK